MIEHFKFTNNTQVDAIGITIIFEITRTQIENIKIIPVNIQFKYSLRSNVILEVYFINEVLAPGKTIDVDVNYEGEPLYIDKFDWIVQKEQGAEAFRGLNESDAVSLNLYQRHLNRLSFINNIQDPVLKKSHAFYADLDYHTNPPLVQQSPTTSKEEKENNAKYVIPTANILVQRVLTRGKFAKNGTIPKEEQLPNTSIEAVKYISSLQLNIYRKHFSDPINTTDFSNTFGMFANGELRIYPPTDQYWNSEPDSTFEFLFAEFAFLAIDNNVDTDGWTSIVGSLVKSQRIFMKVYEPFQKPYMFGARMQNDPQTYGPDKFLIAKQADKNFKEALDNEYNNLSIEDLQLKMGRNILDACPGNF